MAADQRQRIERLQAYFATDNKNVALACDLFDALFENGLIDQAQQMLQNASDEVRQSAGMLFRASRLSLVTGKFADAGVVLQQLIVQGHDSAALWHDLAFVQLCQRDTVQALQTVQSAQQKFGEQVELLILQARIQQMDGTFAEAQAALEKALALEPDNPTAWGLKALGLLDDGHSDAAYAVAEQCLQQYPEQHEALLAASTVALWKGDLNQSETYTQRALSRFPNSGRALSTQGQLHMLHNRLDDARSVLQHAVSVMPEHIGTWHALAWTQLLLGDIDTAEISYQRAYDLDRNFADSHGGLALIHVLKSRLDEADTSIKRALRLNPLCATALYAKSLLLRLQGNKQASEEIFKEALAQGALPAGTNPAEFADALYARLSSKAM